MEHRLIYIPLVSKLIMAKKKGLTCNNFWGYCQCSSFTWDFTGNAHILAKHGRQMRQMEGFVEYSPERAIRVEAA